MKYYVKYTGGYPNHIKEKYGYLSFSDTDMTFEDVTQKSQFSIKLSDIVEFSYGEQHYRSALKTAAGAAIGGILTGGIGLLFGAALGAKRKKQYEFRLFVNINNSAVQVHFKPDKIFEKVYNEIKLKLNLIENSKQDPPSIADELSKLKNLLDNGSITEEEFNSLKNKLLNT